MSSGATSRTTQIVIAAVGAAGLIAVTALIIRSLKQKDSIEAIDTDEAPAVKSAVAAAATTEPAAANATETPAEDAPPSSAEEARRAKERGNKRFAGRQYEMAIAEHIKAIDLGDPTDPEVAKYYGNRAQCHACLEQHAHAESDCDAALKCDPSYVKALARRATAREKLDNTDGALVDFTATLLLSGMNHPSASESIDRLVKKIAAQKADQRLKEPMRCLPSPSFIATFVDSFVSIGCYSRRRRSARRPPSPPRSRARRARRVPGCSSSAPSRGCACGSMRARWPTGSGCAAHLAAWRRLCRGSRRGDAGGDGA